MSSAERSFTGAAAVDARGSLLIALPFDPDDAWGAKPRHPLAGTVNGTRMRAVAESTDSGWAIRLGPAWRRDCAIRTGDVVEVVLTPEGPQRDELAEDVAAALAAEPEAAAFFDGLAQFYRRAYLRWIDGTRRRPDVRAARITEVVELLKAGVKQRPQPEGDR